MLRREVEIMGCMRHPNCVSFYGACFEPGFTGPPPPTPQHAPCPPPSTPLPCRVLGANV
jgi:hypothetical protein